MVSRVRVHKLLRVRDLGLGVRVSAICSSGGSQSINHNADDGCRHTCLYVRI